MFLEKDLIWLKKVFLPKISSNDLNQICKIRVSSSVCVFFFLGGEGGLRGIPHYPSNCLIPPIPALFCPQNIDFVISMQFLIILSKLLPQADPIWETLKIVFTQIH